MVCRSHYMMFLLSCFSHFDHYMFYVCRAHFHAELISASPIILHEKHENYSRFGSLLNMNALWRNLNTIHYMHVYWWIACVKLMHSLLEIVNRSGNECV